MYVLVRSCTSVCHVCSLRMYTLHFIVNKNVCVCVCVSVCVCVCLCVFLNRSERERETEMEREGEREYHCKTILTNCFINLFCQMLYGE